MFATQNLDQFLNHFDSSKHEMLLNAYIESLINHRFQCLEAEKNSDLKALFLSLHDIKSLSYTLGADEIAGQAEKIDIEIKKESISGSFGLLPELIDLLDHALNIIVNKKENPAN